MLEKERCFLCRIDHTACPVYADGICNAPYYLQCEHKVHAVMSCNEKSLFQSKVRTAHAKRLSQLEQIANKLDALCEKIR